jgi:hypothetical protein
MSEPILSRGHGEVIVDKLRGGPQPQGRQADVLKCIRVGWRAMLADKREIEEPKDS